MDTGEVVCEESVTRGRGSESEGPRHGGVSISEPQFPPAAS